MNFFKSKKNFEVSLEERKIKNCIISLLKKENTVIDASNDLKKYVISNKDISLTILIDSNSELVKISGETNYVWKLRGEFIGKIVDLVINKVEDNIKLKEKSILSDEIDMLNNINNIIDGLDDNIKEVEVLEPVVKKVNSFKWITQLFEE